MIVAVAPSFVAAQPEWQAQPMHHIRPQLAAGQVVYYPADIKAAYGLPPDGGSGTIAIIDAYDNPNVASDLAAFSTYNHLPAANFQKVKMSAFTIGNTNWGMEIALDVQWAHAIAPQAKILLVEARTASLTDLLSAVNYARNQPDVVAISMSWGGSEFSGQTTYNSYFTSNYGAVFFASSGDSGGVISWPSSSANVISVGGTTLTNEAGGYTESAWSGSGGGVSAYEPAPSYQAKALSDASLGSQLRATPDVSYNADPNTGFAVYDTYMSSPGWYVVGGTSAGAPQWAAIQALGKSVTTANIYNTYASSYYPADFRDVTSGSSGSYSAIPNYDLCTGIGSPLTTNFATPPQPDFTLSASPTTLKVQQGSIGAITITVGAAGGFSGTVTLDSKATGLAATFDPSTVTGSGESTLTIPADTQVGSYGVTVTGISGAISHSILVNVQVVKPDFSVSASSSSLSISSGNKGTDKITVTPLNGYVGTVKLSATGAPNGVTCNFNPTSTSLTSSAVTSTLTITVPRGTTRGTYTITVQASDGTTSHTIPIKLTIPR